MRVRLCCPAWLIFKNGMSLLLTMSEEILFEKSAGLVRVTLNRPARLNALSSDMIRILHAQLSKYMANSDVKLFYLSAEGTRAFCAGGDVREVYDQGMAVRRGDVVEALSDLFFREEYALNGLMHNCDKPIVSYLNGICMGGGFGLAGNGSHIVVNENTIFAMPEVAIGLFPDVGSMAHLSALPDGVGAYLALTGARINGADMRHLGLAQAYVAPAREERFRTALLDLSRGACLMRDVDALLASFDEDHTMQPAPLALIQDEMKACFTQDSLHGVIDSLHNHKAAWAQDALAAMNAACPTSLKVTWQYLQKAKDLTPQQILQQDGVLAKRFTQGHDFYEGVRAMILDKDQNPQWQPATLQAVDDADIECYFSQDNK